MLDKRIFIEKEIACPSCKISSLQRYPNPKMYAAANRDDDKRVTSYNWAGGIKTDVMPHHYAVLQCPNCMFADFRERFETPGTTQKDKILYSSLPNISFDRRLILRKLRRFVPKEKLDCDGGIALHLCAIYLTLLPDDEEQIDHMKLGRLCLRLSWLYREKYGPTIATPQSTDTTGESPSDATAQIAMAINEMKQHGDLLSERFAATLKAAEERAIQLSFPSDKNPYSVGLNTAAEGLKAWQKGITMLLQTLDRDKSGNLTAVVESTDGHAVDLESFLPSMLPQWPELPLSEKGSVKLAVKAFDYSYKKEDNEQSIQQSMAVVNTIIKMLIKIGELEQAVDYIQQIYKTGFRDKQDLQTRLNHGKRDKSINDAQARNLTRQIGIINNTLSMASDTRKKIFAMLFERDKERILSILEAKAEASPEEQGQAIIDAGFNPELVPFLKENQYIKTEVKKKKWFG